MAMKTNPIATFQPARGPIRGLSGAMYQITIQSSPITNIVTITGAIQRAPSKLTGIRLGEPEAPSAFCGGGVYAAFFLRRDSGTASLSWMVGSSSCRTWPDDFHDLAVLP